MPFMKLPHHNYIDQTVPDTVPTIKDVTEHLLKLITSREDSQKVRAYESALGRSLEAVPSPRSSELAPQRQDRQRDTTLPAATFHLARHEYQIVDSCIFVPAHLDYIPKKLFLSLAFHI